MQDMPLPVNDFDAEGQSQSKSNFYRKESLDVKADCVPIDFRKLIAYFSVHGKMPDKEDLPDVMS